MATSEGTGEYRIRKEWEFVKVKQNANKSNISTAAASQVAEEDLQPQIPLARQNSPTELPKDIKQNAAPVEEKKEEMQTPDGSPLKRGPPPIKTYSVKEILLNFVPEGAE